MNNIWNTLNGPTVPFYCIAIIERSSREEDKNGSLSQKIYYVKNSFCFVII